MSEEPVDDELIRRAREGDQEALNALLARYQPFLDRQARRSWMTIDGAADIRQEALLRASRHLATFRGESSFKTWLRSILSSVLVDFRRRRVRTPAPSDDLPPGTEVSRVTLADELRTTLEQLSPDDREAFLRHYLDGTSHAQIAESTGCAESTASGRVKRARDRLLQALKGSTPRE